MKLNLGKVALILAAVGVGSLLTGVALVRQSAGYGYGGGGTQPLNVEKTVAQGQVQVVRINTIDTDVRWHETEAGEVRIHLHGRAGMVPPELRVQTEQGVLDIDVLRRPELQMVSFTPDQVVLDVYAPKADWKEISIRTTSGDANLAALQAGDFRFTSVSGDLTAEGLTSVRSKLESTSGNFEVRGFTGDLEFRSVSGDLNVEYERFDNEVRLKSTSGDLELDLPVDAKFVVDASSVSGEISVGFPITVTGRQGGHSLQGVVASGQKTIHARTTSGDLRLNSR